MRIKYDLELIKYRTLFENLTGVIVKDCFMKNSSIIVFIVPEKHIGLAIGKNGSNVKKLESVLKKKLKIVEFSNDPVKFVKSLIAPIKPKDIYMENNVVNIVPASVADKAQLIGRESKNLKDIKNIVKRYFDVDVKIV